MGKIKIFAKSSDLNYPDIKPTLNLNFAANKSLDPRITFTRNSIGTYVGPDGLIKTAVVNEPRFDHDPVTKKCLGLMIEESRTNSLLRSENFTSNWTPTNSSVQLDVITAPDGNTTADKLVENSATGNKEVNQGSITFTSGTSLTFSCFVKAGERTLFRLAATLGFFVSSTNAYFNLTSGTVSLTEGGITSASIVSYPNGWYRCIATMLPTSSGTGNVFITLVRSGTTTDYLGDGTSGIYIWGAQLEVGTYATSYIPTSGSTITRDADSATISGTNFSSWYNSTEGTLVSIGETPLSYNTSSSLVIRPNTNTNTNTVSNLLYYPKTIQNTTLTTMNAYANSIITNGLLLYLDAGIRNSYSGSGTTWTDLSGQGNNGTLTNGPTYSSANGGSIVFDGVDDYVTVPSTNGLYLAGTSQVSVSCWGRTNNVNPEFQTLVMWEDIVNFDNNEPIRLAINGSAATNSSFNPTFTLFNSSGNFVIVAGVSTVINSTYYNLVGTYDGTMVRLYINGDLNNQTSFSGNFRTPSSGISARWIIGRGEVSRADRLLNGNIAQTLIYNRALTAAEVQQNFNALRGRFGL